MNVHEQWLKKIKEFSKDQPLELPPPTLSELDLEYVEISPGSKMVAVVPFQKKFTNPVGHYQGGMLSACVDEVFGPLSYITASRPCMTLSMTISFLGAFKEEMGHCLIEAVVLKKTKNFIFMRADIKTKDGEFLAHAESHVKIL